MDRRTLAAAAPLAAYEAYALATRRGPTVSAQLRRHRLLTAAVLVWLVVHVWRHPPS